MHAHTIYACDITSVEQQREIRIVAKNRATPRRSYIVFPLDMCAYFRIIKPFSFSLISF